MINYLDYMISLCLIIPQQFHRLSTQFKLFKIYFAGFIQNNEERLEKIKQDMQEDFNQKFETMHATLLKKMDTHVSIYLRVS